MTLDNPQDQSQLLRLVAVMDQLRSPGGCPWDAEQTHESLVEYLIEECYETIEAIETGDDEDLKEELGDGFIGIEIDSSSSNPNGIQENAHSVLTTEFRDSPEHPTFIAHEKVINHFKQRLFPEL